MKYYGAYFLYIWIFLSPTLLALARPLEASSTPDVDLDLISPMNNRGFRSTRYPTADLDGSGNSYDPVNSTVVQGGALAFTTRIGEKNDNIQVSDTISLPLNSTGRYGGLHLLATSSHGPASVRATIHYTHITRTTTTNLVVPDWRDLLADTTLTIPQATSASLFSLPVLVDPSQTAARLELTVQNPGAAVHVFAAKALGPQGLRVLAAQSTGQWDEDNKKELIQVWIQNAGTTAAKPDAIQISGVAAGEKALKTVIAPGHVATALVPVTSPVHTKTKGQVEVIVGKEKARLPLEIGTAARHFESTTTSVQKHKVPRWLQQAKFGIFIHWGVYSIPAWGPVGKEYSEWYWWQMNHPNDPTHAYHREHYGENFTYDDFVDRTALQSDPRAWLDLVDASHARYFVFTTKHHDGFAAWNTSVTDRSLAKMGQNRRDFVQELISTAKQDYPHLKRGLYFSMPEWYHPAYRDDDLGWHGPPINPYTNQTIPYTNSRPIQDFVNELQVPQATELVTRFEPDLFWCDIGGINNSTVWQSDYFNRALKQGRQVAVNDRCGTGSAADYTTVEYKQVGTMPTHFWESTRGIDPYSFGYNRATPANEYASTQELVQSLVDAVAKGGNFLLNMGPDASGQVVAPMANRLREVGAWLDAVDGDKSIFASTPYWVAAESGHLRFTATDDTVYIFRLEPLTGTTLVVNVSLPLSDTSLVQDYQGRALAWELNEAGFLSVDVSQARHDTIPVWMMQIKNS